MPHCIVSHPCGQGSLSHRQLPVSKQFFERLILHTNGSHTRQGPRMPVLGRIRILCPTYRRTRCQILMLMGLCLRCLVSRATFFRKILHLLVLAWEVARICSILLEIWAGILISRLWIWKRSFRVTLFSTSPWLEFSLMYQQGYSCI